MPKQKAVTFSEVQRQLEEAEGIDILLLMDCCYAARTIKSEQLKAMEVLAAVSREVTAGINAQGSLFTTALIKHLEDCVSRPKGILVSELANLMHHDPILDDQSPQYIPIMGHHNPIILQPLGSPDVDLVDEDGGTFQELEDEPEVSDPSDADIDPFGMISLIFYAPWLDFDDNTCAPRGVVELSISAIIDTGSLKNFIYQSAVENLGLSTLVSPLKETLLFITPNGEQMKISFRITLLTSRIRAQGSERSLDFQRSICFYIIEAPGDFDWDAVIGTETGIRGGGCSQLQHFSRLQRRTCTQ